MIMIDFSPLLKSEYFTYNKEKGVYILLENAPNDVEELFNKFIKIKEVEKQTGRAII